MLCGKIPHSTPQNSTYRGKNGTRHKKRKTKITNALNKKQQSWHYICYIIGKEITNFIYH